jgi:hypothetical protein
MMHPFRYNLSIFLIVCLILTSFSTLAQDKEYWFYLEAKDSVFNPHFEPTKDILQYKGMDAKLKSVLGNYRVKVFKKTYRNATPKEYGRLFFVIADKEEFLEDILDNASHIFVSGERVAEEDQKIFEPNDYGLTSTIGKNESDDVLMDYYDFLGLPKAWYYTTGSRATILGIADAEIDTSSIEFRDKVKIIAPTIPSGSHGSGTAGIAAAQGNNGYRSTGVCYDCSIYSTSYGRFKDFEQLLELVQLDVPVINCSWVGSAYYESGQKAIDSMYRSGTLIIAASGNRDWNKTKGEKLYYPASYDNVISVASASYKFPKVTDNIKYEESGNPYGENIRGFLGRTIGFKDTSTFSEPFSYGASLTTLNKEVDLLAPVPGQLAMGKYITSGTIEYVMEATSPAAPLVTGTVGLMLSLYPCLAIDEIESILKLTSMNIDAIGDNSKYKGNYGAGILQTGDAVEMVFQMVQEGETVTISNQDFSRWDFKLTTYSEEVRIENQKFTGSSTLNLTTKKRIVLGPNTVLKPGKAGKISLKIDPSLAPECELKLRDPSILVDGR